MVDNVVVHLGGKKWFEEKICELATQCYTFKILAPRRPLRMAKSPKAGFVYIM